MFSKFKIKDKNYFLTNLYGANKDAEAVRFYQGFFSITLWGTDLNSDSNVIIGGDLNWWLHCAFVWYRKYSFYWLRVIVWSPRAGVFQELETAANYHIHHTRSWTRFKAGISSHAYITMFYSIRFWNYTNERRIPLRLYFLNIQCD